MYCILKGTVHEQYIIHVLYGEYDKPVLYKKERVRFCGCGAVHNYSSTGLYARASTWYGTGSAP